MPGRILVVDDEPLKRITLQIELAEQGYEVSEAADALTAKRIFDSRPIDVVVSDVRMPGMSGLDFLAYIKQARPEVEVILMTAYATIDTAVLAIKRGAYDYITKPFTTQELIAKLDMLFAAKTPSAASTEVEAFGRVLARSGSMKRLFAQLRSVADGHRPILLQGESGVGKELLAEAIHGVSPRSAGPFVRFSCAGLPPTTLEADLFGQERGAGVASGPPRQRPGRFEQAEGGTIFLDEIDEFPLESQVKLVRAIEQHTYERLGGDEARKVDARMIFATKRDLLKLTQEGRFREDLCYRLNVIQVSVPPLRERADDIPVLANHFLQKHHRIGVELSSHALDELMRYTWPGNVRELEHVIERALAFCDGDSIRPEHVLPLAHHGEDAALAPTPFELSAAVKLGLNETVADIERRLILMALRQCDKNQARAAQWLGIPRTTLRDKMAKYNIPVS